MKSRQFFIHADQNDLLCVSVESEDSAFIQSVKVSEQNKAKAFFSTAAEISD